MAKTKKEISPADYIKNFCGVLNALGVTHVIAGYDGSGDSGDLDSVVFCFGNPGSVDPAFHGNANNGGMSEHQFKQQYVVNVPEAQRLIKEQQLEEFQNKLFYLLPGGWEINEGSYGEITVDVAARTIRVEHNERVMETHTSNYTV
jgi:hypothetical protein